MYKKNTKRTTRSYQRFPPTIAPALSKFSESVIPPINRDNDNDNIHARKWSDGFEVSLSIARALNRGSGSSGDPREPREHLIIRSPVCFHEVVQTRKRTQDYRVPARQSNIDNRSAIIAPPKGRTSPPLFGGLYFRQVSRRISLGYTARASTG